MTNEEIKAAEALETAKKAVEALKETGAIELTGQEEINIFVAERLDALERRVAELEEIINNKAPA